MQELLRDWRKSQAESSITRISSFVITQYENGEIIQNSSAYDEWFYDGFTHGKWKDDTLAYWFWSNLNGGDQYPSVKVSA